MGEADVGSFRAGVLQRRLQIVGDDYIVTFAVGLGWLLLSALIGLSSAV